MSVLTLVRHGQATAFQKESDRLSETGELQARRLAAFWLKNQVRFDEVYTGTLVRQTRTEQIVAECFDAAGEHWPQAGQLAAFNEYDATGVLDRLVPALAARLPEFRKLVEAFQQSHGTADRNGPFQRMFEVAMGVWIEGAIRVDGVEPFDAFRDRVRTGLRTIMNGGGSRRVAIITSGGPIGLSVSTAMKAPDTMFLDVNWRIRNASLTDFLFSGGRLTLDSFNAVPHLDDVSLWTYR